MWSGGGGGALPPLPFSIPNCVAGVEEKQDEEKKEAPFATAAALRFGFAEPCCRRSSASEERACTPLD